MLMQIGVVIVFTETGNDGKTWSYKLCFNLFVMPLTEGDVVEDIQRLHIRVIHCGELNQLRGI